MTPHDPKDATLAASAVDRAETASGFETRPVSPGHSFDPAFHGFLAPPQQPDEIGRLGRYRILDVLGRGGMGLVFHAEDPALRRAVALKVMLPAIAANPQAKARFIREARAQAAVEHDHVIPIHDIVENHDPPFLTMPLLKGMTLASALRANPRPPLTAVVRIGREIAAGLAAAHDTGLIHRDIKPANIWLEGSRLRVKILDFGLARAASENDPIAQGGEPLTAEGAVVGTPMYMSPEQARGELLDCRTDLFSLGVVLYQMATGQLPFTGTTTAAVLLSVVSHHPTGLAELDPPLPPALNALIQRLLTKERDAAGRPASAAAVADHLQQIEFGLAAAATVQVVALDAIPSAEAAPNPWAVIDETEAAPDTEPARRHEQPKRGTRLWLAAGVGGLFLVAGLAFVMFRVMTKPDAPVAKGEEPPPAPQPKPAPKPKAPSPDRRVADWVLSVGGEVKVGDDPRALTNPAELPAELRLSTVVLKGNAWKEDDLIRLRDVPELRGLTLDETPVTNAGLTHVGGLKELRGVTLSSCTSITDAGMRHLRQLTLLNRLNLYGTPIGDAGLRDLAGLPQLYYLYLSRTQVTDEGLPHLGKFPALLEVHLNTLPITNAGLAQLATCKKLKNLWLSETRVTDDGLIHLEKSTTLRELNLKVTKVTKAGVEKLAEALPLCKITYDGGVGPILPSVEQRKVLEMVLSKPGASMHLDLTGMGAQNLLLLQSGDKLPDGPFLVYSLLLHFVEELDANMIVQLKAAPTVHQNLFFPPSLRNSDLAQLATYPALNKAAQLDLRATKVTDAGLVHVKPFTRLTYLNLRKTPVTDEGLKHLYGCSECLTIELQQTQVTKAGVEKLSEALPKCKIEWDGGTVGPKK